jgi:hypothetical protein
MNGTRDFYREFAPPPDLRHVVACLRIARADAVPVSHAVPIIPDGCADIFESHEDGDRDLGQFLGCGNGRPCRRLCAAGA